MQIYGPLDALPLWGFFMAVLFLVLVSVEGGYRVAQYRRRRSQQEMESPVGAMVGATLGLLAFMLAFTFGYAAERFDLRRQLLLDEANAIGTTYLRSAMLPERREEIRSLLRDYVDTRLDAVKSNKIAEGIRRSEQLQDQLWAQTVILGERNPTSVVLGLFVTSLNEVIDLHAKRVTAGVRNRIPGAIWPCASCGRRPCPSRHGISRRPCGNEQIARASCRRAYLLGRNRAHRRSRSTARGNP